MLQSNTASLLQSCRCDNTGEQLVVDMLDISHDQSQEGMTLAWLFWPLLCIACSRFRRDLGPAHA